MIQNVSEGSEQFKYLTMIKLNRQPQIWFLDDKNLHFQSVDDLRRGVKLQESLFSSVVC